MTDKMTLDFTNVKEGGGQFNKKRQPAGDYRARVIKAEDAPTKEDKKPQWLYTIQVGAGKYPYYCQFEPNVLWKIRNLLVAAGITVPKKKVAVKRNLPVGKYIGVTLEDAEWDNKEQSEIAAVFPTSELVDGGSVDADDEPDDDEDEEDVAQPATSDDEEEEDEEEEPEPAPVKKKKKAKPAPPPVAEEEDEDDLEELDIEDM